MIAGSVVVETVFSRSGIGLITVKAVTYQDTPLVLVAVVFAAAVYVTVNFVVDLFYPLIDRRIDAQRARLDLARALRVPDVVPTATLTHAAEPEFNYGWRAGVAVTLPLFAHMTTDQQDLVVSVVRTALGAAAVRA